MPRIAPFSDTPDDPIIGRLLENGEVNGTPDSRMVAVFGRSEIGAKWLEFCATAFTDGLLSVRLKELLRIRMSVAEECGYCSSLRSKRAIAEGLTEQIVVQMVDLEHAPDLSASEIAALRFGDLYRRDGIDSDEVFDELRRHFTDEEIIELGVLCSMLDGGGKFAKALQVISWEQACEVRPTLSAIQQTVTAAAAR
jgi:AhpD family alkylhydroperoxidase